MILSLGALRWGVSHGRRNDCSSRGSGYRRYGGYNIVGFCMAFFNCASETGAILDLVIFVAARHAEVISFVVRSFLLG